MISIKKLLISLAFLLILLSACSEKKKEVTKLENVDSSELLIIQKVEGNSKATEDNIIVKDKKKIEQILAMVDGIKVEETTSKYMMDEMKKHTTYMFNFEEDQGIKSGENVAYAFDILEDGTIFFTHKDVHSVQKPRISIEKHKDLLKKIQMLTENEQKQK
ncbi:hypothetical protein [Rummeliibacillus pycnus]|uniref:hypothetical protein n=1 Tax=Rummeliibacillus pycnus TaxID=101070 RepID=UPI003D26CFD2